MGELHAIGGEAEVTREALARELEDAARRVRRSPGRPTAVGIVVVAVEDGDAQVYTTLEGRDLMRLAYGAWQLAKRCSASMLVREVPPDHEDT